MNTNKPPLAITLILFVLAATPAANVLAQHKGFFLYPHLDIGFTRNYNANGISLGEINSPGQYYKPSLDIGYMFKPNTGLMTGVGFSNYRYKARMVYSKRVNGNNNTYDTVVDERQQFISVPAALKVYLGEETRKPMLTGYLEAGLQMDLLLSATYTTSKGASGRNKDDFFPVLVKGFFKMGADIPTTRRCSLLLAAMAGISLIEGVRQEAVIIHGYGITLPFYGINLGYRLQL